MFRFFKSSKKHTDDQSSSAPPRSSELSAMTFHRVRLYTNAIQSILSFLTLPELATTCRVSHDWYTAGDSMASANFALRTTTIKQLQRICYSRYRRHIVALDTCNHLAFYRKVNNSPSPSRDHHQDLTDDELALMYSRMSRLRTLTLDVNFNISRGGRVVSSHMFAPSLCTLTLMLYQCHRRDEYVNRVIQTVAALPRLRKLHLGLPISHHTSFRPLSSCIALEDLTIVRLVEYAFLVHERPTEEQIDDIRDMNMLTRVSFDHPNEQTLFDLLRAPHHLRWQRIACDRKLTPELCRALRSLPSLTDLACSVQPDTHPELLRYLPNLVRLDIDSVLPAMADNMCARMSSCVHLQDVSIARCAFTSAHMCTLLASLPQLKLLSLSSLQHLESLRCFMLGNAYKTLQRLTLTSVTHELLCEHEMYHLFALRALTSLTLSVSFRLGDAMRARMKLPSADMPTLTHFMYSFQP